MALFRKRVTLDEARARLLGIVLGDYRNEVKNAATYPQAVSTEALARDLIFLRLFSILIALRETNRADWRAVGRDLFASLDEPVVSALSDLSGEGRVVIEAVGSDNNQRFLLATQTISEPSLTALENELGDTFREGLCEHPDDQLSRLGSTTVNWTLGRAFAYFDEHRPD